jgi:hypothetical protein
MAKPLADRFWAKVNKTDSCWLWTGGMYIYGYGKFYVGKERAEYAHRMAWQLTHDIITDNTTCVLHQCDNPCCVRPDHLFLGTRYDNVRDMDIKGRRGTAKLNKIDVLTIRSRYAAGGITHRGLAKQYDVSKGTITFILSHRTWRHLL